MICNLCPHNCQKERNLQVGICQAPAAFVIAHQQVHLWEEPCISGTNGSGTIFFSYCNLKCVYCQNYQISQDSFGKSLNEQEFVSLCLKLKQQGVHNINLVSPTIYSQELIDLLPKLKASTGLTIIWNSNAYEKVTTLQKLSGLVDVYLPDFKYADNQLAVKYSQAPNYVSIAQKAIKEMIRQVPDIEIDDQGLIKKGVIIRHLILPGLLKNSQDALEIIAKNFRANVWVSLMAQYYPISKAILYPEINRHLTSEEYEKIVGYYNQLNFKGGYQQKLGLDQSSYTPVWDANSLD